RDFGGRLDPLQRAHGAGALAGSVHARGIELDHAVSVGQAPVANGIVVGVELLDLHALDHRVERIGALHEHVERLLHRAEPVRARTTALNLLRSRRGDTVPTVSPHAASESRYVRSSAG